MSEYIVRETDCGLATKQEIVGELVRCKECNHFKRDISCVGVYGERKTNTCEWHGFADVKPDWYCADGERKDNETD